MLNELAILKAIVQQVSDGVVYVNTKKQVVGWNQGAEAITGYPALEAVGRTCCQMFAVPPDSGSYCTTHCPFERVVWSGKVQQADVQLYHRDGSTRAVRTTAYPWFDDQQQMQGVIFTFAYQAAVQQQMEKMRALIKTAYVDAVSGLHNKTYLQGKLEQMLEKFHHTGEPFTVVFIHVPEMYQINAQYGQSGGDSYVKQIAGALAHCVDPGDVLGRWYGVNFVLVSANTKKNAPLMYSMRFKSAVSQLTIKLQEDELEAEVLAVGTQVREYDTVASVIERAEESVMKEWQERQGLAVETPEKSEAAPGTVAEEKAVAAGKRIRFHSRK